MNICVFCGAHEGTDQQIILQTRRLGEELANREIGLVYGGGGVGLMGIVADAAIAAGGEVTGIIPEFLAHEEVLHQGLSKTILVGDLFERKAKMILHSDAFITLPGGMGTLDELLEILTWRQLHQINKPIGILNINDYFDPLLIMLEHAANLGFYDLSYLAEVIVEHDVDVLLDNLISGYS